jgi:Ca2+/Na+ antiporter
LFVPSIFIHILNLGDSSQGTVATRIDQINMISDVFSDNIINFLFGMGSGTPIYSNFHGMNIYNIEIAPLEFIRKYGVIFFAIIFSLMFKIILQNFKIDKSKSYLLIALFLCTFSNPILTAPLFIFIFILCNNNSLKTV